MRQEKTEKRLELTQSIILFKFLHLASCILHLASCILQRSGLAFPFAHLFANSSESFLLFMVFLFGKE